MVAASVKPYRLQRKTTLFKGGFLLNSSVSSDNTNNREFSTMDYFPTTLASLGVTIEDDRLGLGTNLFSDKKTILEEFGKEEVSRELAKNSRYYNRCFVNNDCN